jgi:hypothetical protein
MLTIEPPFYQVRGLTVFRDHQDLDQFYCLPGAVALARTGPDKKLAFTLYKYRRDLTDNPALDPTRALGAGLALFEVEIPINKPEALRSDVAGLSQRPNARVDPVLFRSGSVHAIAAHASGDDFIEDLVETSNAPIASPYHAAFALALSAEGSTFFEQAVRGGQVPVGVVYELRFLALTPSLHARVTMDYDRIYDHFSASVGLTVYYVSLRLDLDLSWLVEHDFIRIEIIAFTDAADRDRQQDLVMNLVKTRIQNDFFRSGIPPEPSDAALSGPLAGLLGGLGGSKVSSTSALFVLKAKLEVVKERKDFQLIFDGQTAVELTHVVPGFLSTMVAGAAEPLVHEIDTDDPFFSALNVKIVSTINFAEMSDLREAVLHIVRGLQHESYSFDPKQNGPYAFLAPITKPEDDLYQYEVEYHFDPNVGGGPTTIQAGPFSTRKRVLTLDPLEHFGYLRLDIKLGPVDPALVPRVRVFLRIKDPSVASQPDEPAPARVTIELTAQTPVQVWRQRLLPASSAMQVFASTEWEDTHGEAHSLNDEVLVPGSTFVAMGPYKDLLTIVVIPAADWTSALQLQAELRYTDGDYLATRLLAFNPQTKASQTVQIPLLHAAARKYQWRQLVSRADGTVAQTDWIEVDQSLLVIGAEKVTQADVRVVWAGSPGAALGLRVDLWAGSDDSQPVSVFLRTGMDTEKTVTVPLTADGALNYRYEIRRITEGGEELVKSAEGTTALLLVH